MPALSPRCADYFMINSVDAIAAVCYEANRAWQRELLGSCAYPEWSSASTDQRREFVEAVRFHLRNPNASAAATHEEWMRGRYAEGWTWGPTDDPDRKSHPRLKSFRELPPEQRLAVYLLLGVIRGLTALSMAPRAEVDIIDFGDSAFESDSESE